MVAREDILDSGFGCCIGGNWVSGDQRDFSFHFVPFEMTCSFKVGERFSGGFAAAETTPYLPANAVIPTKGRNPERLRDPSSLVPFAYNAQPTLMLRYGYTGHEHLPELT